MVKKGVLKEHAKAFDILKRVLDILIVACSAYLTYIYRFGADNSVPWTYLAFIFAGILFAAVCFHVFPLYRAWRGVMLFAEYRVVFFSWGTACFLLIVVVAYLKMATLYSREWLIIWFLTGLFLMLLYRFFLRITLSHYRRLGFNQRSVCLITYGNCGEDMYKKVAMNPEFGFYINAVFSNKTEGDLCKGKLTGSIKESYNWLQKNEIDQLWIAVPIEKIGLVKKLMYEMRHKTADIRFIPDLGSYNLLNHSITEIAGIPFVNLNASPMQENVNCLAKRCEDILLGSLILLLISPVLLIIAIIIKCTSEGTVLYKQTRLGLKNKSFTMLKFRSMVVDAEKQTGAVWAKAGEKRATPLTPFGSFLRRTSLDELPQFMNVVKGNMSIVGPRPERPELVEQFKNEIPSYMKKHMVKAGITGWAQVNGWRGDTDLKRRIEHDIYYIENWSLFFDIKIIIMTMLKRGINKNAY